MIFLLISLHMQDSCTMWRDERMPIMPSWENYVCEVIIREVIMPTNRQGLHTPFVSPYVNVAVSGGDGALVRKLAFSGGCASGLVKKCKVHTLELCVVSMAITMHVKCHHS